MTCIDLYDDLQFEFKPSGLTVLCSHPDVPEDESNLAHRSAVLFYDSFLKEKKRSGLSTGLTVTIKKRIPVGGGLGGGSSNAATVLKVLNRRHGNPFSPSELMALGLSLGADVPFFIHGGPALARGVGEKLLKTASLVPYRVLLLYPGTASSTSLVYKNLDLALTNGGKTNNNALLNLCRSSSALDIKDCLYNDLEPVACRINPDIESVKKEMALLLDQPVVMTGSGSSFFVLYSDDKSAEAAFKKVSKRWKGTGTRVFLTSFKIGSQDGTFEQLV